MDASGLAGSADFTTVGSSGAAATAAEWARNERRERMVMGKVRCGEKTEPMMTTAFPDASGKNPGRRQ